MTIPYACDEPKRRARQSKSKSKSGSTWRGQRPFPERNGESDDGVERFHGDGLVIRMRTNHRGLEITGDGCRLALSRNSGNIRIVGDGCVLRVTHNEGNIEYTGDGGRVLLGSESAKGKVRFVGDGGEVMLDSSPGAKIVGEDSGRSPKKEGTQEATDCLGKDRYYRCKEVIDRTLERGTLSQEELDNMVNDMRDQEKRNEGARGCSRQRTVTKIITEIQSGGQCVRKRTLGDSSLVVNCYRDYVVPVMKSA